MQEITAQPSSETPSADYDWKQDVNTVKKAETPAATVPVGEGQVELPDISFESEEYELATPEKLTDRPFVLIGVVSGGLFGLLLLVLLSVWGFSAMSAAIQTEKIKKGSESELSASSVRTPFDESSLSASEEEILRARLSAKNRDAELAQFNAQAKGAKKAPETKPSKSSSSSSSVPASRPPSSRVSSPPTVKTPKIIYRNSPPPPSPVPKPAARKPQVSPTPRRQVSRPSPPTAVLSSPPASSSPQRVAVAPPPLDPYQAWEQLTNLGSFGGGGITAQASPAVQDALYVDANPEVLSVFNPNSDQRIGEESALFAPDEITSEIQLPLGTTVKGKLLHDVAFVNGSTNTDKAVVELSDPLGEMPKGALVSTQIEGVDDSGALSLSILGYESNNEFIAMSLPQIQATSAPASRRGKNFANRLLNIGADFLQSETGQSIEFSDSGRISSVRSESGNGFVDRLVGATSQEILGNNRNRQSTRRAPKVKAGSTVKFVVVDSFY